MAESGRAFSRSLYRSVSTSEDDDADDGDHDEEEEEEVVDGNPLFRGSAPSHASAVPVQIHGSSSYLGLPSSPLWPRSYSDSVDAYSLAMSPKAPLMSEILSMSSSFSSSLRRRLSTLDLDQIYTTSSTDALASSGISTAKLLQSSEYDKAGYQDSSVHSDHQYIRFNSRFSNSNDVIDGPRLLSGIRDDASSTMMQSIFNGTNVMAGVGLLSCPYAMKEGGWLGLLVLAVFSILCCYTCHLLCKCMNFYAETMHSPDAALHPPLLRSYPDIAQLAFGKVGRTIISIMLYAELYAYCVEYLILEGDNLAKIFPAFQISSAISPKASFAILATAIVLPTVWLQNLTWLCALSFMGVISTCVVLLMVVWMGAMDGIGFTHSGPLVRWNEFPLAIGVYGFCYSGHAVFPNIYASMKNKDKYLLVLVVSFGICTFMYAVMAVVGYFMFGDETLSQITLNLPTQYKASYLALFTTILNPFTKFALMLNPITNGLEELIPAEKLDEHGRRFVTITIRTLLLFSTLLVATMVPFFGHLMSLIGSVLSMLVTIIVPCSCFLSIYRQRTTNVELVFCTIGIFIGTAAGLIGMYSSIVKISDEI